MRNQYGQRWLKPLMLLSLTLLVSSWTGAGLSQAAPDFGGTPQFQDIWTTQDALVGTDNTARPYTWGLNVAGASPAQTEVYLESPDQQRRVVYLDKARMELNQPASEVVTTGLLVKELVSGQRQDGNQTFVALTPSETQVAGDPVEVNPDTPTYASFKNLVTLGQADQHSVSNRAGQLITQQLAKKGSLTSITPPESVTFGTYEALTGHNIARPFADFMQQTGSLTDPVTHQRRDNQPIYTTDPTSQVFGLAISEPYWVVTRIAGRSQIVLVQLFERRVLTYNPALPGQPLNKVEMGNLGQHYYRWRYLENSYLAMLPFYPGSTQVFPTNLGEAGRSNLAAKAFNSDDTLEQVQRYYNQTLTASGWQQTFVRELTRFHYIYHKNDYYLHLSYGEGCGAKIILLLTKTSYNIYFNC